MDQEGQLGKNLVMYQYQLNHLQSRPILLLFAYRWLFCRRQRHQRPAFLRPRLRQPPPRSPPAPVVCPPPRPRPLPVSATPPPRRRRLHSPMSTSTTSTVSCAYSSVLRRTVMTRRRRIAYTVVIAEIADLSVITSASRGTFALRSLSTELKRRMRIRRVQIIVIQAEKRSSDSSSFISGTVSPSSPPLGFWSTKNPKGSSVIFEVFLNPYSRRICLDSPPPPGFRTKKKFDGHPNVYVYQYVLEHPYKLHAGLLVDSTTLHHYHQPDSSSLCYVYRALSPRTPAMLFHN